MTDPLPEMWLDADSAQSELVVTSVHGDLLRLPLRALPTGELLRWTCTPYPDLDDPDAPDAQRRYLSITVREIPGPGEPNTAGLPVYWCHQVRDPHPAHTWAPRVGDPHTYHCNGDAHKLPEWVPLGHPNGCQGHPSRDEKAMPGSLYYCDGSCAVVVGKWLYPDGAPAPAAPGTARISRSALEASVGRARAAERSLRFERPDPRFQRLEGEGNAEA